MATNLFTKISSKGEEEGTDGQWADSREQSGKDLEPLDTNLGEDDGPMLIDNDGEQGENQGLYGDSDDEGSDVSMSEGSDSENGSEFGAEEDKMENVLGWKRLSIVAADMKKGDMWKACYDLTVVPWFWILCTILLVSEPCICSYDPNEYEYVITASWIIIALSSVFLFIQLGGKTYSLDEKNLLEKVKEHHKGSDLAEDEITGTKKMVTLGKIVLSGSFVLELVCIAVGWIFIFYRPGIAALRCFRMFRVLWYHELPPQILEPLKRILSCVLGRNLVDLVFKVMKFATVTLSHLGQEMVFLTKKSRGGLMLMILLFYIAYVLGATLWVETRDSDLGNDFCVSLGSCTYTMMRLTFFDGNGFDFAYSLADKHPILFAISVMYLCVTSFGIVNGLIGVFGDIFKDDSDRIFETNKASEAKAQLLENEHFQRYNNTSESLVMLTLKMSQLEEQNEMMRESLKLIAKSLKVDLSEVDAAHNYGGHHTFKAKSGKTPKTKKHAETLRALRASQKSAPSSAGGASGTSFFY